MELILGFFAVLKTSISWFGFCLVSGKLGSIEPNLFEFGSMVANFLFLLVDSSNCVFWACFLFYQFYQVPFLFLPSSVPVDKFNQVQPKLRWSI